jgi:hypothetical protein
MIVAREESCAGEVAVAAPGDGEWRRASVRLPPSPSAPRVARRFTAQALRAAGHEPLAKDAALLVSELMTNPDLRGEPPLRSRRGTAMAGTGAEGCW